MFRHQARYLRVNLAMGTGESSTAYMSVEISYPDQPGWRRLAMVSITNTNLNTEDDAREMLIDLGIPRGESYLIYVCELLPEQKLTVVKWEYGRQEG
ncbi:hypothetical protein ABEX55_05575 [Priestia endophytica]|jgi:hypothetical protein|uniref:hypothetical protein n=1 Tax=Priestia endophytica TaxID=135735 RepID=UPI003D2BD097